VTTWKQYKEFVAHHERLNKPASRCSCLLTDLQFTLDPKTKEQTSSDPVASVPSETADAEAPGHDTTYETEEPHEDPERGDRSAVGREPSSSEPADNAQGRRPARGDEPFEKWEREEMEKLLDQLCGHLGM
jgi:phospholipase D1/2